MLSGVVPGNFTNAPAGCATYDVATDTTTIKPSCYSTNSQVYLTNVFESFRPTAAIDTSSLTQRRTTSATTLPASITTSVTKSTSMPVI